MRCPLKALAIHRSLLHIFLSCQQCPSRKIADVQLRLGLLNCIFKTSLCKIFTICQKLFHLLEESKCRYQRRHLRITKFQSHKLQTESETAAHLLHFESSYVVKQFNSKMNLLMQFHILVFLGHVIQIHQRRKSCSFYRIFGEDVGLYINKKSELILFKSFNTRSYHLTKTKVVFYNHIA